MRRPSIQSFQNPEPRCTRDRPGTQNSARPTCLVLHVIASLQLLPKGQGQEIRNEKQEPRAPNPLPAPRMPRFQPREPGRDVCLDVKPHRECLSARSLHVRDGGHVEGGRAPGPGTRWKNPTGGMHAACSSRRRDAPGGRRGPAHDGRRQHAASLVPTAHRTLSHGEAIGDLQDHIHHWSKTTGGVHRENHSRCSHEALTETTVEAIPESLTETTIEATTTHHRSVGTAYPRQTPEIHQPGKTRKGRGRRAPLHGTPRPDPTAELLNVRPTPARGGSAARLVGPEAGAGAVPLPLAVCSPGRPPRQWPPEGQRSGTLEETEHRHRGEPTALPAYPRGAQRAGQSSDAREFPSHTGRRTQERCCSRYMHAPARSLPVIPEASPQRPAQDPPICRSGNSHKMQQGIMPTRNADAA
ncbi:unnamed protein product [Diplocarpon coronariae]